MLSIVSKTYNFGVGKWLPPFEGKSGGCDAKKQQLLVSEILAFDKSGLFLRRRFGHWSSRIFANKGLSATMTRKANHNVDLFVQLLKLSSMISGPMQDGVAAPNDVALNEIKILMCLGGEGALAGHDIADIMAIPPMNISRALASLFERGWIEPVIDTTNRRRKPVQLSTSGWEAHQEMTPDIGAVADYLLGTLSVAERASMGRSVHKIVDRMADWFNTHHVGTHVKHPV
jgi:DNA-binding MarR family transcriptional regulator